MADFVSCGLSTQQHVADYNNAMLLAEKCSRKTKAVKWHHFSSWLHITHIFMCMIREKLVAYHEAYLRFSPFPSLMYVNGLVLQCAQAAASTSGVRRLCKKTQSQEMVKVSCRNYYAWMQQLRNIKFISALLRSWMTFKAEDKSKRLPQKKRNYQNPDWAPSWKELSCNRPKIVWNNTPHLLSLFHVLALLHDWQKIRKMVAKMPQKWMSSSQTTACSPCRFIFTRRMPGWGWRKTRQSGYPSGSRYGRSWNSKDGLS